MKLLYISYGNIPSRYAHTVQMMKMAEALNGLVERFCLATQCNWKSLFRKPFDYFEWYGIRKPFRIVRFPLLRDQKTPFIESEILEYPKFIKAAVMYARLMDYGAVYTRWARTAVQCVQWGVPVIFETHMDATHPNMPLFLSLRSSPLLLGVVTISTVLQETYIDLGVPDQKILVFPDAVNLEQFNLNVAQDVLRSRLGLPTDRLIVVYCGHLYANRGIEEILLAAEELSSYHFVLIGGQEADIETWRNRAQSLTNMEFTGFIPNSRVPEYLAAADVLLMPYSAQCSTAGWMSPMKLFEYMAARKPIIASDLTALRTVLHHGENAWLVPPDDARALAKGIQTLASDHALGTRLAQAAYQDVHQYTWERRAKSVSKRFLNDNRAAM